PAPRRRPHGQDASRRHPRRVDGRGGPSCRSGGQDRCVPDPLLCRDPPCGSRQGAGTPARGAHQGSQRARVEALSMEQATDVAAHDDAIIAATRRWIERAVIGLELCPFARAPFVQDRVRIRVSHARDAAALAADLQAEAELLASADPARIETTLLVHPQVFADFLDYNDFLDVVDALLVELELEGVLQVASFHPDYRFADAAPDAIENSSNRSP